MWKRPGACSVSPGVPCLSLPERHAHDTRGGCSHDTRTKTGTAPMPLTELPFGFPGRVFRSPMAFGPYDLHGEVYDRFCEEQMSVIVLLASDKAWLHKTGCHLRALYHKAGFQVLYLPMPDFSVPPKDDLEQAGQHTIAYALKNPQQSPFGGNSRQPNHSSKSSRVWYHSGCQTCRAPAIVDRKRPMLSDAPPDDRYRRMP
jgi:hypothetical protein